MAGRQNQYRAELAQWEVELNAFDCWPWSLARTNEGFLDSWIYWFPKDANPSGFPLTIVGSVWGWPRMEVVQPKSNRWGRWN